MVSEEEKEEDAAEASPAGGRARTYWRLSLAFIFLFLAGGGYYALSTMGDAAHKLVAGGNYNQLSANSAVYSEAAALRKSDNFFPQDELGPAVLETAGASGAGAGELKDPAGGRKLSASSGGAGTAAGSGVQAEEDGREVVSGAQAALAAGTFSARLQARASLAAAGSGGQASRTSGARETEAFGAGAPAAGRPSAQRETNAAAARKGGVAGVLDSLKGAFSASFYGARIASHDSARSWLARSFDATPEASSAIEYEEKMRARLDRLNPDSIPKFLREQDVSAAEARTLAASEVGKPQVDVKGTKEALKNDKDYQSGKLAQDMAAGAINPIGNLFSGGKTGGGGNEEAADDRGGAAFVAPEDEPAYGQAQLDEYIAANGYGEVCGCTKAAPCCCLPPNVSDGATGDFSLSGLSAIPGLNQ
ncbi:MAG TPA: hypothetical protein DCS63_06520 [Elusimicrobia bacterium]|nr:hypothetical protein [Elusimicrobiota bacterium]